MGFKLAIVPGLLLKATIGACDDALAALKSTHVHPAPHGAMTVRDAFNRVGRWSGRFFAPASAAMASGRRRSKPPTLRFSGRNGNRGSRS